MTWWDCIGDAWSRVRQAPLRTILAIAGVAVGAGTLTFMTSSAQSLFASISSALSGEQDFALVTALPRDPLARDERRRLGSRESAFLADHLGDRAKVWTSIRLGGAARVGIHQAPTVINGVSPEQQTIDNWILISGRFITDVDVERRHSVCAITNSLHLALGPDSSPGRRIAIGPHVYTVVGVITKAWNMGPTSTENVAVLPITVAQTRYYQPSVMALNIHVVPSSKGITREFVDEITRLVRSSRGIPETEDVDFSVQSSEATRTAVQSTADAARTVIVAAACWGVVVSLIGVLNSVFMSVTERIYEIGLLRALGAKQRDIGRVFLIESGVIATAGACLGTALGALAAIGLARGLDMPARVDLLMVTTTVVGCAAGGMLCGFWPARSAARLNPVDALRHEGAP